MVCNKKKIGSLKVKLTMPNFSYETRLNTTDLFPACASHKYSIPWPTWSGPLLRVVNQDQRNYYGEQLP